MGIKDIALDVICDHEILRSNENKITYDAGGVTKYGISLRFLKLLKKDKNKDGFMDGDIDKNGIINSADVINMDLDDARKIYGDLFDNGNYTRIKNPILICKLFDMCVNMGETQAAKLLQRSTRGFNIILKDDGIIGDKTLGAVNSIQTDKLILCYQCQIEGFYRGLVMMDKNTYGKELNGWLNRCYDNLNRFFIK